MILAFQALSENESFFQLSFLARLTEKCRCNSKLIYIIISERNFQLFPDFCGLSSLKAKFISKVQKSMQKLKTKKKFKTFSSQEQIFLIPWDRYFRYFVT